MSALNVLESTSRDVSIRLRCCKRKREHDGGVQIALHIQRYIYMSKSVVHDTLLVLGRHKNSCLMAAICYKSPQLLQ